MKRILFLGGSTQQIPPILYAKEKKYYTVLCDYLVDNPGKKFVDKFYCVSTTDKEAILKVAKKENIDGIVAYASDPAAPTAAYVGEKMGVPTNTYHSVETLAYKNKFREFLKGNNFHYPISKEFDDFESVKDHIHNFSFPVIVKPVDSSGSKGISKVESDEKIERAFYIALENSRMKKIIIEEFIMKDHEYLVGGDCFVVEGKVEFWGLLNCHRDPKVNPLVPVGKSYPLLLNDKRVKLIKEEVQRLVDSLDLQFGAFNIECIIDKNEKLYFIEMGPRNGGNMIPELLEMISGVDLVAATIEAALGTNEISLKANKKNRYFATHNLHTAKTGQLKGIHFDKKIKNKIVKKNIYKEIGDPVSYFDAANKAIGIVFLEFENVEEEKYLLSEIDNLITITVE